MKRVVPRVATALSILSGQIVYVEKNSAVSVMIEKPNGWKSIYIPSPLLLPFESWAADGTKLSQIAGETRGLR